MDWFVNAACRGMTDVMFPVGYPDRSIRENSKPAKEICSRCPVIEQCKILAMREHHGVWAGQLKSERIR